jgi:transcriptional regulator with XRE-family HTH domain
MEKINPEILKLAREVRSITQEELATLIGIEQGTLSKIEKGILQADNEIVKNICKALDFPATFFYQDKKVHLIEGHYRRKISTSVKKMFS